MASQSSLSFPTLPGTSSWFACSSKPSLVQGLSTAEAGGRDDGKRDQEESRAFTLIPSKIYLNLLSPTVSFPVDWLFTRYNFFFLLAVPGCKICFYKTLISY